MRKIKLVNLGCKEVNERHTAENIKKWIIECFEDYQVERIQIFVISVDSAANISKGVRTVIEHLNKELENLDTTGYSIISESRTENCRLKELDASLDCFAAGAMSVSEFVQAEIMDIAEGFVPDDIRESAILLNCAAHKLQLGVNQFLWLNESEASLIAKKCIGNSEKAENSSRYAEAKVVKLQTTKNVGRNQMELCV